MGDRFKLYLKNFDWLLFAAVLLLACFGLIEIYSIALGQGSANWLNFDKQAFFIVAGVILVFVFSFIDYRFVKSLYRYLYAFGILILLALLFVGHSLNGTKGWFYIFGFGIQPVEFVKLALIVFLARFFSGAVTRVRPWRYFVLSALSSFVLIALVMKQPDLGSALVLFSIWLFMLIFVGFDKKYFIMIVVSGLILAIVGWFFLFHDYQKQRLIVFFNSDSSSLSQGYNSSQAIIAIGSGGLTGRGVAGGSQSQNKFLPEAQTDFIFSVISEELGFLGVSLVLLFYSILFFRSLWALRRVQDDFAIFFILGTLGLIFVQMFTNIGMNIGILPVVGLPLPFISYGGSSILTFFVLIGIIENIIIKSKI
jgi:rod shape determining protein RodA